METETTETTEAGPGSPELEEADEGGRPATEVLEQLGRDLSALLLRELELGAARNSPVLGRTARDAAALGVAVVALATAFLLANWAAVRALSMLPGWLAPLVLAAGWAVVGGALVLALLLRSREVAGWSWWRAFGGGAEIVEDRERARDDAQSTVRETLEELAGAVAREAEARIASAVMPLAGGIVDAGEELLDASEEILDDVVEQMPGGSLVGQVIDFVLIPGRFGVRIVTTVLKGSSDTD